jgi:TPR repeat protein
MIVKEGKKKSLGKVSGIISAFRFSPLRSWRLRRNRRAVLWLALFLALAGGAHSAGANDRGERADIVRKASAGDPALMLILGLRYDYGQKGMPHDLDKAVYWYRKSANLGYPPAEMILSQRYEIGRGVPQDDRLAVQWLEKSARHGYPPAEDALGDRYAIGQGIDKNSSRALAWYRKAAAHGYGESQDLLGERYETGQGVPKNFEKAAYWYLRAARDAGNPDAFFRLGRFSEKGLGGLRKDPVQALAWYTLAKDTSLSARKSWVELTKSLPEKDQTLAWKRAMEFRSRFSVGWNRWVLRP